MESKNATQTKTAHIPTAENAEPYLQTKDREEREVMTRLRGGTNELRIEIGR